MQDFLDKLITQGYFAGVPRDVVYAGGMVVFAVIVVLGFVLNVSGVTRMPSKIRETIPSISLSMTYCS